MTMDPREAKLALARRKLKDHQSKKSNCTKKNGSSEEGHAEYVMDPAKSFQSPILTDNITEIDSEQNVVIEPTYENEAKDAVNLTEVLSSKTILEAKISELHSQLSRLEFDYSLSLKNNNECKQHITNLENDLKMLQSKLSVITEDVVAKDKLIQDLKHLKSVLSDENNNLQEQLEFTKTILTTKELDNNSLNNQINNLQSQVDVLQLQLQQLTNGVHGHVCHEHNKKVESDMNNDILAQKVSMLEQQLKDMQKERDQINLHYEHYVKELTEQLNSVISRNEDLAKEIKNLSNRETYLVDLISEMEIRIQNYQSKLETVSLSKEIIDESNNVDIENLTKNHEVVKIQLQELNVQYDKLKKMYTESQDKVEELSKIKENRCDHDDISIIKLNADIASDKVAAQRATEQNKKLKIDLQELEEAFIKISKDKLELTEKVSAEKYLNRQLTIKLAEIDEKAKDLQIKLKAKDEEMIRIINNYREMENQFGKLLEMSKNTQELDEQFETDHTEQNEENIDITYDCKHDNNDEHKCLHVLEEMTSKVKIPQDDAMSKLQERFLKIMGEVADLSDEKHRLEHIILQLQNETDTICEYVALYQQQRSLLKKRDEERNAQIKIFQEECDLLKNQLEELSSIIIRFAQDKELSSYFEVGSRSDDIAKVMNLLSKLKNNTLIDHTRKESELKDFYPCSCCSGKLIDI